MSYWTFRIGLAIVIVGLLLLSPASDFLPVELSLFVQSLLSPKESPHHAYMRVVLVESSHVVEFIIIGVGLTLVAIAMYFKKRP